MGYRVSRDSLLDMLQEVCDYQRMGFGYRARSRSCTFLSLLLLVILSLSGVRVGVFCWTKPGLAWQTGLIMGANTLYLLYFAYSLVQYLKGGIPVWFIVALVISLSFSTLLISRYACPEYYIHDVRCTCAECQKFYDKE